MVWIFSLLLSIESAGCRFIYSVYSTNSCSIFAVADDWPDIFGMSPVRFPVHFVDSIIIYLFFIEIKAINISCQKVPSSKCIVCWELLCHHNGNFTILWHCATVSIGWRIEPFGFATVAWKIQLCMKQPFVSFMSMRLKCVGDRKELRKWLAYNRQALLCLFVELNSGRCEILLFPSLWDSSIPPSKSPITFPTNQMKLITRN